jgi:hypothetical protein
LQKVGSYGVTKGVKAGFFFDVGGPGQLMDSFYQGIPAKAFYLHA